MKKPGKPESPVAPIDAPAVFPAAPVVEDKRGPGRPPKICPVCGKSASECKGHTSTLTPAPALTEVTVKYALQFVSQMLAVGTSIAADIPIPEAIKLMGFSEPELAVMATPATEVANKYLPDWMLSSQAEVQLMLVAGPILVGKLILVKSLLDRKKAEKQKAAAQPASSTKAVAGSPTDAVPRGEIAAAA